MAVKSGYAIYQIGTMRAIGYNCLSHHIKTFGEKT